MSTALQLALVWALAAVAMTAGWAWQRRNENAGIVDVIWSACTGGAAVLLAALGSGAALPRTLLAILGGAWGLRLALHLWRRVRGEAEDGRYRSLRERWRDDQGRFFLLFQFQAVLVPLFALPFLAVAANPKAAATPWLAVGIAIWLASVAGEAVADRQLARFRAERVAGVERAARHVPVPALPERNSAHRGTGLAHARR